MGVHIWRPQNFRDFWPPLYNFFWANHPLPPQCGRHIWMPHKNKRPIGLASSSLFTSSRETHIGHYSLQGHTRSSRPDKSYSHEGYKSYCTYGIVKNKIKSFSSRFSIIYDFMSSDCDLSHACALEWFRVCFEYERLREFSTVFK